MSDSPDPVSATIRYYDANADAFWEGTRDHDVTQNYAALLEALDNRPEQKILDLGCGPGRDLIWFRNHGHRPVGLDASAAFVEQARARSGCEVWQQDFCDLDLPDACFDGIFANATLFHVPKALISDVLGRLKDTLIPEGVLFCSNPRGNDEESFSRGRLGVFYRDETWLKLVEEAGFVPLGHYWRPDGQPRDRQPWFASIWRKPAVN